jgi:hypothetical protein
MNSHSHDAAAAAAAAASMSGVGPYASAVFERLLHHNRTTSGPIGASPVVGGLSPLSGDVGGMMNQQDILSAQRENRNRMLAALQQQQRQLTAASMAARGLPVLHQNMTQDFRGAQRFMVDDFAGAGNLLSRSEQEILLSRYPSMAAQGHAGLGGHPDLDFGNTSKLADLLLAKQVAFHEANKPRTTRLPCQARGMKADHNSSVRLSSEVSFRNLTSVLAVLRPVLFFSLTRYWFASPALFRLLSLKFPTVLVTGNTCCAPTPDVAHLE